MNAIEFKNWIDRRDAAMRTLDTEYVIAQGCPPRAALMALHKARYECTSMEPELRHASRKWLQDNGCHRMHNEPWPPEGELPE